MSVVNVVRDDASALPLLVSRICRADHAHDTVAPHDLAFAADLLHRCQYLHVVLL